MGQRPRGAVHKIAKDRGVLVRSQPVKLRFCLLLSEPRILTTLVHDVFDLEPTCLGPHVVHGYEIVQYPAEVRLSEGPAAEPLEKVLEPVFKVRNVVVNILRAANLEESHTVDRPRHGLISACGQEPGLSGIGLEALK